MKRTFKYALSAVLGALLIVPALAQDNFPDVPESHWAYKELARMKAEGLLVGYPDGLFRGGRPASRYELAVACHAVWANLKGVTDGLKAQIDDLTNRMANAPTKADLDNLRSALDALTAEVNRIKNEDIAGLRRLMDEFRAELTKMGADVDQMKKDLDAMRGDVAWLKQHALPFDVSGDANFWMGAGYARRGTETNPVTTGITVDGRPTGVGRGSNAGGIAGAGEDLTILHEAALKLVSNNASGPTWKATMVYGNMMGLPSVMIRPGGPATTVGGLPFFDQSLTQAGFPFGEGADSFYFQEFSVNFDTSIAGLGFNAELGRIGVKVSPYIFQRPDATPYFSNSRWDNGNWNFDGGTFGFKFGGAKLNVFGGRTSGHNGSSGFIASELQPMTAGAAGSPFLSGGIIGPAQRTRGHFRNQNNAYVNGGLLTVDQMFGTSLNVPLSNTGSLSLAYLWLNSNGSATGLANTAPGTAVDGVTVYGGDLKFNFSNIDVTAGYSKSDVKAGNRNVISRFNSAWYGQAGYAASNWGLNVGYRRIEQQFGAPGDWGRIGIWWNPTDIEGFYTDAHFDLSRNLRLMANAGFYRGINAGADDGTGTGATATSPGASGIAFNSNDHVDHYNVGIGYKMGANHNLLLGYENVMFRYNSAGPTFKPRETWWNIGWGFDMNSRTNFNVLWQFSDADGKQAGFSPITGGPVRARGGFITSQLTVRF